MLRPFRLHEPTTATEASSILASLGEDAHAYAGGTELLLAMKQGLLRFAHLVDIKPIGLSGISFDEATRSLRIGATTTHRTVERSEIVGARFPLLASMEQSLANVRVRAIGTVGGNLSFAEPHSDLATVLLLHNASLRIGGTSGQRTVGIADLFLDAYTTCLRQDELLLEIEVPELPARAAADYRKLAFFERPSVGVGAVVVATPDRSTVAEARIAVGCVGPRPFRVAEAEAALAGVPMTGQRFSQAVRAAAQAVMQACTPADDLYGSATYKRHLAGVFVERTVAAARARIGVGGNG